MYAIRSYYDIDGIWNKETDADWLTELQVPVGPAKAGGPVIS